MLRLPLLTRTKSARMPPADHFHVHIVNANHLGLMGMTVGQAHMLDDIISLVRAFYLRDLRFPFIPCFVDS